MKLWHGTSSRYIAQILEQGLRPGTSCYGHVCLSSDEALSRHFGAEMAAWEKSEMVLFSIEMDGLDAGSLCHEMGWIGNSLEKQVGEVCLAGTPLEMLEAHRVIGYRRTIPPELLTIEDGPAWLRAQAPADLEILTGP